MIPKSHPTYKKVEDKPIKETTSAKKRIDNYQGSNVFSIASAKYTNRMDSSPSRQMKVKALASKVF